ncbi:hypothetical protein [Aquabacterium sp. OR-4]|uniref:hypothetical protein n=1 Tax=Aquabacterium sp. OR-4 TaxID=2978127 RepID=UPI0021B4B4CD|nr:hypothetical protein [Aquabacterium sp. OR-4]MDT7837458.1 hypothetical protein [Aquabacterium sp. OR-4]
MNGSIAASLALACAGGLLLVGLLLGVWKYRAIRRSAQAQAPEYVSTAHRAALMYAFATVLLGLLAQHNALPTAWAVACVLAAVASFVLAIGSYVLHGVLRDTDNQFAEPMRVGPRVVHSRVADAVMAGKALAELAAVGGLLGGYLRALGWV